jgi:hypothetical protein
MLNFCVYTQCNIDGIANVSDEPMRTSFKGQYLTPIAMKTPNLTTEMLKTTTFRMNLLPASSEDIVRKIIFSEVD